MNFQKGDIITYEYLRKNDGTKHICIVGECKDGWVFDAVNRGTHLSSSFRPEDVVIWEVKKGKR